jgi:hypothetical protein
MCQINKYSSVQIDQIDIFLNKMVEDMIIEMRKGDNND